MPYVFDPQVTPFFHPLPPIGVFSLFFSLVSILVSDIITSLYFPHQATVLELPGLY